MTPYAVATGHITQRHLELLDWARRELAAWPDGPPGAPSCHDVCRALARLRPGELTWVYGRCGGFDHSWLAVEPAGGERDRVILDPYPTGQAGGPVLLAVSHGTPWGRLYDDRALPLPGHLLPLPGVLRTATVRAQVAAAGRWREAAPGVCPAAFDPVI